MFDPRFPANFNSLNSLLFAELPDYCPKEYLGNKGYNVLSSQALSQHIQANLTQLELEDGNEWTLRLAFFQRLEAGNPSAVAITEQMGQALGVILLTLHHSTEANRLANPS